MGLNVVILTGRLTRDIEVKKLSNDKAVANFSLAVNRKFNRDEVDFINCITWGKTAEIAGKYLKKGNQVGVQGSIRVGSYEKDGQKRYKTAVYVDQLEFLESKVGKKVEVVKATQGVVVDDEEFPF